MSHSPHDRTTQSELLRGELSFCVAIFYCARVFPDTAVVAPHRPWLRTEGPRFWMQQSHRGLKPRGLQQNSVDRGGGRLHFQRQPFLTATETKG
jgi:hypothetical protein